MPMPSSVFLVSFCQTRESSSSSVSRRALRSTAAAPASQSARPVRVLGCGQRERALLGLQLGGFVESTLDGRVGHVLKGRSLPHPGATKCDYSYATTI